MGYKLGKGSQKKLEGIDERMAAVVRYAIGVSKQDFSVICGLRTIEEQKALVAKGASQTMKSKHIDGLAHGAAGSSQHHPSGSSGSAGRDRAGDKQVQPSGCAR